MEYETIGITKSHTIDLMKIEIKRLKKIVNGRKLCTLKYALSDKGKEAQYRANKKYYEANIKTGKPVGRPRKTSINV